MGQEAAVNLDSCQMLISLPSCVMTASALVVTIIFVHWFYRSLKLDVNYGDQYVLITGCDTGFGNRCAKRLDSLGFHVFATCLTAEKMKELAAGCSKNMVTLQMDVTSDVSVQQALGAVKEHLPTGKGLWALINNAGVMGSTGVCEWLQKADYETTLRVNFLGMVTVTNTFLPLLRKARGRIVNTGSVLGRVAFVPASYSVSKFCVEAFSDCLRREMAKMGVSVHIIEPGGYETAIVDKHLHVKSINRKFNELDAEVKAFYGESYKTQLASVISLSCDWLSSKNLDEVVDAYLHAITACFPKIRYVVGINGNLFFRPLWTLPVWLVDFLFGLGTPKPEGS